MLPSPPNPSSLTPEQFRRMLEETLADPKEARRILFPLLATAFPITGGACNTPAGDVAPGAFGAGCAAGDYSFPGKVGIQTPVPTAALQVSGSNNWGGGQLLRIDGTAVPTEDYQGSSPVIITPTFTKPAGMNNLTAYSLYIDQSTATGTGSFVNAYGLYVKVPNIGTNNYAAYFGGKVGIGTPTPQEKLDVAGNILSQGLNKIVFLRPSGGDDKPQIDAAISALPPEGGIIYLMPHLTDPANNPFRIGNKISVAKNGVKL